MTMLRICAMFLLSAGFLLGSNLDAWAGAGDSGKPCLAEKFGPQGQKIQNPKGKAIQLIAAVRDDGTATPEFEALLRIQFEGKEETFRSLVDEEIGTDPVDVLCQILGGPDLLTVNGKTILAVFEFDQAAIKVTESSIRGVSIGEVEVGNSSNFNRLGVGTGTAFIP